MKTKFYFFAVSLCLLMACGSNGGSTEGSEDISVTGSDGKVYTNYQEACRNGDFDAAYSILEKKREAFEKFKEENELVILKVEKGLFDNDYVRDESNKKKYDAMVKNYEEGMDYVFNAEMLFLASQNTEETSNRILYLLAEYHIPGTPTAPGGEYNDDAYGEVKKYIAGISRFNKRCNSVLDMAIAQKNEKLAHSVVKIMKQNVDVSDEFGSNIIISSKGVNNIDIDLAKKKLEEAIKSGAFN